jgi:hypothetical protein
MAGKTNTISTQPPALGAVQVQTSTAGLAIPQVWGRTRVGGNLLWYGDFKSTAVTEDNGGGGKGGGGGGAGGTTRYIYEAAVIMALAGVPLNGVVSAWKGKQRYFGETINGRITSYTVRATVPAGGFVTVDVHGGAFAAGVSVVDPENSQPGFEPFQPATD